MVKWMRVCIFGNYYPHFDRSATITTSLSFLISSSQPCSSVTVYGNKDSELPPVLFDSNVSLKKAWQTDDLISISKLFLDLLSDDSHDIYIFNVFLTCFGRKPLSNFLGLLLPVSIGFLKRGRVITYMQNFLETQEIERLGYRAGKFTSFIVRMLEKALANCTQLITTLPSMSLRMEEVLKRKVGSLLIPYADAVLSYTMNKDMLTMPTDGNGRTIPTILLFGSWGPQKELPSALNMLSELLLQEPHSFKVIVAGSINSNFPEYERKLRYIISTLDNSVFNFLWNPPESQIASIFMNSDVALLPYNTTGGASGVLQLASFYSLDVVAYEAEQLKELNELIQGKVTFFPAHDVNGIKQFLSNVKVKKPVQGKDFEYKIKLAYEAVMKLLLSVEMSANGDSFDAGNSRTN